MIYKVYNYKNREQSDAAPICTLINNIFNILANFTHRNWVKIVLWMLLAAYIACVEGSSAVGVPSGPCAAESSDAEGEHIGRFRLLISIGRGLNKSPKEPIETIV